MRQRQRRCSAKRRSWAYTRHSLGAASRCVEGVAPRAVDLARPPSGSAGAAADRRCASRPYSYAPCRRACARRRVAGVALAARAVGLPGLRAHRRRAAASRRGAGAARGQDALLAGPREAARRGPARAARRRPELGLRAADRLEGLRQATRGRRAPQRGARESLERRMYY